MVFNGAIHCDGYEAYHKLENAKIYGCFAHARRYFVNSLEVSPLHKRAKEMNTEQLRKLCVENPAYGNIVQIVNDIKFLFVCESEYVKNGLSHEEIKKKRQEEQKPKLDDLFIRLKKHEEEYTAKSKAGVAITYALNQWKYLTNYLNDGATEISNNRGERYIKPFVIGRKAWLFSNTKSGANMSSIYYSLIESAKQNQLNIHKYLEYVLTQIQENPESLDYMTILPYSKELPECIKVK